MVVGKQGKWLYLLHSLQPLISTQEYCRNNLDCTYHEGILNGKLHFLCSVSNYHTTQAYSELSQVSKMELSAIINNGFQPFILFAKSSILNVSLNSEYAIGFADFKFIKFIFSGTPLLNSSPSLIFFFSFPRIIIFRKSYIFMTDSSP